jgi:hypothetical protein
MGLFLDIENLSARQSDDAIGAMYKAIHDHNGEEIWLPVDNPFIARLVELFTQRGLDRLEGFRRELLAWSQGERHRPTMMPVSRPADSMERWSGSELALVKLYLEHLPPGAWTLDDHMMMVDFLVQRYLPADDIRSEAEWMASRANLMGRVQANMERLDAGQADALLAVLPATAQAIADQWPQTPAQRATMDFSRVRAAENVRKLADDARHRMRGVIAQHVEERMLGAPGPSSSLETKLLDEFGTLNRDWRRVAVTEAVEAQNQGYIASVPRGTRVKRVEQYRSACSWCRKIDGLVMTVVDPADPDKDGESQVWVGKTNVGRSAAPRKRLGDLLIEREPEERWWPAAGAQHPHCRGRWVPTIDEQPGDDPDFAAWLRNTLGTNNGQQQPRTE